MSEIALRTYVEQLDSLIERRHVDEVLAHCRHILSLYPKHLDTYRMLGKALLEKGRHTDAADIFQRVLSVAPEDFVAHVGMAIVREDETNLDSAIWHMERAFESSPSNGAIQQDLCRLYGRRDGMAPSKARLTRGALARMYSQGGLFLQAEAELKAALSGNPDRIDLQTLLARVYWQSGQPAEAAQLCAAILQKLPYSLDANRILSSIFREQGRAAEAAAYRQRLEALDPYEAFIEAGRNGATAYQVEAGRVTLDRLDYVPGTDDGSSPDWLTSIGAKFEEPEPRAADGATSWLRDEGEEAEPASPDDVLASSELPDWLRDLQPGRPADAPAAEPPTGASDWLRDLGLDQASPAASPDEDSGLPDWLRSATGQLAPEAVPDWMQPAFEKPVESGAAAEGAETGEGIPEWLAGLTAPAPDAEADVAQAAAAVKPVADDQPSDAEADEAVPEWMRPNDDAQLAATEPDLDAPTQPMPAVTASGLDLELPDVDYADVQLDEPLDRAQAAEVPAADTAALPDWLSSLAPVEADEPADIAGADIPAWLKAAAPDGMSAGDLGSAEDLPDWLRTATSSDQGAGNLPAWMRAGPSPESGIAEPQPEQSVPVPPAELDEETLAWLQQASGEATLEVAEPAGPGAELLTPEVDRLSLTGEDQPTSETALAELEPAVGLEPPDTPVEAELPAGLALDADGDLPDWLRAPEGEVEPPSLAIPEADTPTGLTGTGGLPDWLQAPDVSAQPPAPPEVPDWLREVAEAAPSPDAATEAIDQEAASGEVPPPPSSKPAVELPDYLQPASAEAIARAQRPFSFDDDDIGAEDEAAEPDEPDLVLPADIPEWLQALAPVSPDPTPAATGSLEEPADEPMAAATLADDDTPSWMPELAGDQMGIETPPWLAAVSAEEVEASAADIGSMVVPVSEEELASQQALDLPPWAQTEEPGPTDTIASWLKSREAPQEARPEPTAPGAARDEAAPPREIEAADLPAAVLPTDEAPPIAAAGETAEPHAAVEPGAIDEDEALRWLESLAAQQGARPEELITAPHERPTETPAWIAAQQDQDDEVRDRGGDILPAETDDETPALLAEALEQPTLIQQDMAAAETLSEAAPAEEAPSLESWFSQMEEAMPPGALEDTAPAKYPDVAESSPASEPTETPTFASAEGEASGPGEMDSDEALGWLESLAARQGVSPEELITPPESRPTEAPRWIAAQLPAETEPPTPEAAAPEGTDGSEMADANAALAAELAGLAALVPGEPGGGKPPVASPAEPEEEEAAASLEADDEAMRWLEALAARQGAQPEELATPPDERLAEPPTWIAAEVEPEPEPLPEPEPATAFAAPEWLPAEADLEDTLAAGDQPEAPPPDSGPPSTGDTDRLSRLAERLAETRRTREAEIEARFAEQRAEQEAARRLVQERMVARRTEAEPAQPAVPVSQPEPAASQPAPDYAAAAERYAAWVATGENLDQAIRELEALAHQHQPPAPMLRILGDAYARRERLAEALDAYRMALERL